jgi:hypothetical protein
MNSRQSFFAGVMLTIFAFGLYLLGSPKLVENYGGPIKNVKKIPISSCYQICDNWAYHCEKDRPGNYGGCETQRNACRAECYFSNSQRM